MNISKPFCEACLTEIIEAFDFENVENVSSLSGAIVGIFCANNATADITEFFTKYFNFSRTLNRKQLDFGWTEKELEKLGSNIKAFKEKGTFSWRRIERLPWPHEGGTGSITFGSDFEKLLAPNLLMRGFPEV